MVANLECAIEGCAKRVVSRGWCSMHYARWRLNGTTDPKFRECKNCGESFQTGPGAYVYCGDDCAKMALDSKSCAAAGCDKKSYGSRYCPMHQKRLESWGSLEDRPPIPCGYCGNPFVPHKNFMRLCSDPCRVANKEEYAKEYFARPDIKARAAQRGRISRAEHGAEIRRRKREQYDRYRGFIANHRRRCPDGAVIDPDDLKARMSMFGHSCWMCGCEEEAIDHVKPLSAGGQHILSNLRPICAPCNHKKHASWPLSVMWARLLADDELCDRYLPRWKGQFGK